MKRGDRIIIRDTYVVAWRQEVYIQALRSGIEPEATMGFPKEDVTGVGEAFQIK